MFDGTPIGGGGEAALEAEERHDSQAKQSQMTKVETRNLSEGMGPLCLRDLQLEVVDRQQRRKKKERTLQPNQMIVEDEE